MIWSVTGWHPAADVRLRLCQGWVPQGPDPSRIAG